MTTRYKELGIEPVGLQYRNTFERAWHTTYQDHAIQLRQLGRADDVREVFDERTIEAAYLAGIQHAVTDSQEELECLDADRLVTEIQRDALAVALRALEPYLDTIVCYASTTSEHEGNRVALQVTKALALLNANTPDPK